MTCTFSASITGSIISTTILEPTVANGTQEEPSDEVLASCGINDCPDNAFSNPNLEDPKDSTVNKRNSCKFIYFYREDLLTYKNLQKYATKYIHIYNIKYDKMAA